MGQVVNVYVDEVYLYRGTGVIRAAIPIPQVAVASLEQEAASLRQEGKVQPKEFKGSQITGGNEGLYTEFLLIFARAAMRFGLASVIRPTVSIETQVPPNSAQTIDPPNSAQTIEKIVSVSLRMMKAEVSKSLLHDFAMKTWWIACTLEAIRSGPDNNEYHFIFDNVYNNASEMDEPLLVPLPEGFLVQWHRQGLLSEFLDKLLPKLLPEQAFPKMSLDFSDSRSTYALQACDVLSNVFHGRLSAIRGLRSRNARTKERILSSCFPGFSPPEELLDALGVDGHELVGVRSFASMHQINPRIAGS